MLWDNLKTLFLRRCQARVGNRGVGMRIIVAVSHFVAADLLNIQIKTWKHYFYLYNYVLFPRLKKKGKNTERTVFFL